MCFWRDNLFLLSVIGLWGVPATLQHCYKSFIVAKSTTWQQEVVTEHKQKKVNKLELQNSIINFIFLGSST